jgi:hypothetical protein
VLEGEDSGLVTLLALALLATSAILVVGLGVFGLLSSAILAVRSLPSSSLATHPPFLLGEKALSDGGLDHLHRVGRGGGPGFGGRPLGGQSLIEVDPSTLQAEEVLTEVGAVDLFHTLRAEGPELARQFAGFGHGLHKLDDRHLRHQHLVAGAVAAIRDRGAGCEPALGVEGVWLPEDDMAPLHDLANQIDRGNLSIISSRRSSQRRGRLELLGRLLILVELLDLEAREDFRELGETGLTDLNLHVLGLREHQVAELELPRDMLACPEGGVHLADSLLAEGHLPELDELGEEVHRLRGRLDGENSLVLADLHALGAGGADGGEAAFVDEEREAPDQVGRGADLGIHGALATSQRCRLPKFDALPPVRSERGQCVESHLVLATHLLLRDQDGNRSSLALDREDQGALEAPQLVQRLESFRSLEHADSHKAGGDVAVQLPNLTLREIGEELKAPVAVLREVRAHHREDAGGEEGHDERVDGQIGHLASFAHLGILASGNAKQGMYLPQIDCFVNKSRCFY